MTTIQKRTYGSCSTDNYGAHAIQLDVGSLRLWFSYDSVVAFQTDGHLRRVSENLWGPTTGKHLNAIDGGDKKNRLSRDEFEKQLDEMLAAHELIVRG